MWCSKLPPHRYQSSGTWSFSQAKVAMVVMEDLVALVVKVVQVALEVRMEQAKTSCSVHPRVAQGQTAALAAMAAAALAAVVAPPTACLYTVLMPA